MSGANRNKKNKQHHHKTNNVQDREPAKSSKPEKLPTGTANPPDTENIASEINANLKRETDDIAKLKTKPVETQITTSWTAYELPQKDKSAGVTSLNKLLDFRPSRGSNFQFEHEKHWTTTATPISSRFLLNTKSLAEGLSSIVFYERQNLPVELFSEQELEKMHKAVKVTEKISVQSKSTGKGVPVKKTDLEALSTRVARTVISDKRATSVQMRSSATGVKAQDSDSNVKEHEKVTNSNKKSSELEDWLDGILED